METENTEEGIFRVLSFLLGSVCLLLALFCWFVTPTLIGKISLILILIFVAWEFFYFVATGRPAQYFKKK
jgi:hypothetical protein